MEATTTWSNILENITNVTNAFNKKFNKDLEVDPFPGHYNVTVRIPGGRDGFIRLYHSMDKTSINALGTSYRSSRDFREVIPLDANFDAKLTSLIRRKLT